MCGCIIKIFLNAAQGGMINDAKVTLRAMNVLRFICFWYNLALCRIFLLCFAGQIIQAQPHLIMNVFWDRTFFSALLMLLFLLHTPMWIINALQAGFCIMYCFACFNHEHEHSIWVPVQVYPFIKSFNSLFLLTAATGGFSISCAAFS